MNTEMFSRYWNLKLEALKFMELPSDNPNKFFLDRSIEFYSDCSADHCRLNVLYAVIGIKKMEKIGDDEIMWWLQKTYSEFVRCLNDVYGESRRIQVLECAITPGCGIHPGVGEAYYIKYLDRKD